MNLQFEPIGLAKQKDYLERLARCPQTTSDYSFINLWAWGEDYGLRWAWDERFVWIKQTRPEELLWAPIGPWDEIDWKARFEAGEVHGTPIVRVPEKLVERWRANLGDLASFKEERGHWDYLYAAAELIELKGNRFHKKKNLLNQFHNKYDCTYLPLGPELISQAMAMQDDWCTWRDCESSDLLTAENQAIYRTLRDWDQLQGPFGGAIMADGSMIAYTVAERLAEDTVLIHFEKGDTEYKGIYQAINQMFLEHSARNFKFVNREQDLNDEGLRKAKLSYLPVDFLRKYRVTLKAAIGS